MESPDFLHGFKKWRLREDFDKMGVVSAAYAQKERLISSSRLCQTGNGQDIDVRGITGHLSDISRFIVAQNNRGERLYSGFIVVLYRTKPFDREKFFLIKSKGNLIVANLP